MHFPASFGDNRDSFEECIRDLVWQAANGYVMLYGRFWSIVEDDPLHWKTASDILRSVVEQWSGEHIPSYVLLRE